MAHSFKRGKKYYGKYKDWQLVDGKWVSKWKVVVGSTSKRDTLAAAQQLENDAFNRANGLLPPEPAAPAAIKESVRAYEAHLTDARNTQKYVDLCIQRIESTFNTLGIKTIADLGKLKTDLAAFLSPMTGGSSNHYKRSIKGFLRFHKQFELASDIKLHKVNDGEQRRALEQKQQEQLFKAAEKSPKVFQGLTGRERAMLYRLACGTGLRASELRSLKPSSFRFGDKAMVFVPGAETKNGEDAWQPIPSGLAKLFKEWLPKSTDEDIWPGNWNQKAAKMLRADLEAAKIPFETAEGVADFHALRVTYGTNLARAGVPPTIAQKLMRHSTINLTLEIYTKFTSDEVSDAVDKLG